MNNVVNHNRKHDIRNSIPLTKFTNPGDFPQHVHRDFPLMLTKHGEDKMVKGKVFKPVVPVLDENEQPVIVSSVEELETYLEFVDEALAEDIRSLLPKSAEDREEENMAALSKLADANDEIAKLKKLLADQGVEVDDTEVSPGAGSAPNKLTGAARPAKKPNKALPQTLKASK